MLNKVKIFAIIGLVSLSSCSRDVPKCSDSEVVKVTTKLIYDQVYNLFAEKAFPSYQRGYYTKEKLEEEMKRLQISLYKEMPTLNPQLTGYKLESIRTIEHNKENHYNVCSCFFKMYNKATKETINQPAEVHYTVQLTDDKKEFVVNLVE